MSWIVEDLARIFSEFALNMLLAFQNTLNVIKFDIQKEKGFFLKFFKLNEDNILVQYKDIFMGLAVIIVVIIVLLKLMQVFIGPFTDAEPPGYLAVNGVLALAGVYLSYNIMDIIMKFGVGIFDLFKSQYDKTFEAAADMNSKGLLTILTSDAASAALQNSPGSGENLADNNIFSVIIVCMLGAALVIELFKLMIEIYERYVTMGLLYYTCPLAFSMICSKGTKRVFSSWFQMVASQILLMGLSLFFVSTAYVMMMNVRNKSWETYVGGFLMVLAWIRLGQNIDELLKGLGLSAAQTGQGLGMTALAAGHSFMGTMRMVQSAAMAPFRAAGGFSSWKDHHEKNKERAEQQRDKKQRERYDPYKQKEEKMRQQNQDAARLLNDAANDKSTKEGMTGANKRDSLGIPGAKQKETRLDKFNKNAAQNAKRAIESGQSFKPEAAALAAESLLGKNKFDEMSREGGEFFASGGKLQYMDKAGNITDISTKGGEGMQKFSSGSNGSTPLYTSVSNVGQDTYIGKSMSSSIEQDMRSYKSEHPNDNVQAVTNSAGMQTGFKVISGPGRETVYDASKVSNETNTYKNEKLQMTYKKTERDTGAAGKTTKPFNKDKK